ncbi:MAG: formylglycine-generating enzyme family protein [Coleofasciculaceae cyanobacterium SM2_1_6]|nr:formylglycine-generating enzyme family protein [Coleofasciculaceae cyanobacterium SM2_1_6]
MLTKKPRHQVTLSGFAMGKYLVTQAQWQIIARSPQIHIPLNPTPSLYHGNDRCPVEQISWHEAQEFCARLSNLADRTYRLPSEAEWEYACRAVAEDYTEYSFGDEASDLDAYGWYGNNSGHESIDAEALWQEDRNNYTARLRANGNRTHPVGEKMANAWGLHDMHGNVWEWCADDWHDDYVGAPEDGTPWLDTNNDNHSQYSLKVLRGGSWNDIAGNCRSALRNWSDADYRVNNLGFRVVVAPP